MKKSVLIFSLLCIFCLSACKPAFEPINYGHDACMHCKMTILDKRYAAEILTKKGRTYKFDDIACLRKYIKEENLTETDLMIFVADYNNPDNNFLDARAVVYLHSEIFKSPMNGDFAAFSTAQNATPLKDSLHIGLLTWDNLN
jgi:copper chaperone NosL